MTTRFLWYLASLANKPCRVTRPYLPVGNVLGDHTPCTYDAVIADLDIFADNAMNTDKAIIPDIHMAIMKLQA